jgi:hypothetical protein
MDVHLLVLNSLTSPILTCVCAFSLAAAQGLALPPPAENGIETLRVIFFNDAEENKERSKAVFAAKVGKQLVACLNDMPRGWIHFDH